MFIDDEDNIVVRMQSKEEVGQGEETELNIIWTQFGPDRVSIYYPPLSFYFSSAVIHSGSSLF